MQRLSFTNSCRYGQHYVQRVRSTVEEALCHYEARLRVIRSEQGYDFNEAHLMPGVSAAASWDGMNG
jgi:phage baseplate assembly protein W